jgi:hypothetical protein
MGVRMRNRLLPRWDIKALVKALGAQERVLLFCVGSRTDRKEAGVTLKTVASLVVNFLVTPFPTGRLALTDADLAALRELVARAMRRRDGGAATGVGIVVPTIENSRLRSTGKIRGRLSE